jgi:hypothetical protein
LSYQLEAQGIKTKMQDCVIIQYDVEPPVPPEAFLYQNPGRFGAAAGVCTTERISSEYEVFPEHLVLDVTVPEDAVLSDGYVACD